MAERLQKVLAAAGFGSRRACEDLVRSGRVRVDGVPAELGQKVEVARQVVTVDGDTISLQPRQYWLLNKPTGVVTTVRDPQGRPTVIDCVPADVRVFPVGRLDRDTTGVLLLTNDGELAERLLHPRFGVEKEYRVLVDGAPSAEALDRLRAGVPLEEGTTRPAAVTLSHRGADTSELMMIIHEGRKRQIRRMCEVVGHPVVRLHRSRFDGLSDAGLAVGAARPLTSGEIDRLRAIARGGGHGPTSTRERGAEVGA